jgi:hypothetical protein
MAVAALQRQIGTIVKFFNYPLVKEGIKNISGAASFVFGWVEVYDLYKIARGRSFSSEENPSTIKKISLICTKLSLILSGAASRPGIYIFSKISDSLFTPQQLHRLFGPNTIFALNPRHPRHIFSIAAAVLTAPAIIHLCWSKKIEVDKRFFTDTKAHLMAAINGITSRLALHLGNKIVRLAIVR